jgi:hypothetical protein
VENHEDVDVHTLDIPVEGDDVTVMHGDEDLDLGLGSLGTPGHDSTGRGSFGRPPSIRKACDLCHAAKQVSGMLPQSRDQSDARRNALATARPAPAALPAVGSASTRLVSVVAPSPRNNASPPHSSTSSEHTSAPWEVRLRRSRRSAS